MRAAWSMRRMVSVALLAAYASLAPLVAIVLYRLHQVLAIARGEQGAARVAALGGLDLGRGAAVHADLAIRDVVVYLAVWLAGAVLLLAWTRRQVVRPALQLRNVLQRAADGDLDAPVQVVAGGEMRLLSETLQLALRRFGERERLQGERLTEMRSLVQRLVELFDQPVLVVGSDVLLDYANEAAALAFGASVAELRNAELAQLPGGTALTDLVREVLRSEEGRVERVIEAAAIVQQRHVARCCLVRDARGAPSRVVVLLKREPGAWWKRLWG